MSWSITWRGGNAQEFQDALAAINLAVLALLGATTIAPGEQVEVTGSSSGAVNLKKVPE